MKKIAVIGAGAVGCYYGGMLVEAGLDVHFLMRSDLAVVRRNGLRILSGERTEHLQPVQAYGRSEEIGECDLVIIALKATANAELEHLLPPLVGERTALLTLQNGLGNEEFLAARWGRERVMGALCYICLNRTGPGIIEHLDQGWIALGEFGRPVSERIQEVAQAWSKVGVRAVVVENLLTERWRKLIWNIPFNGLSIVGGGLTVADVLADEGMRGLARALMGEALAAAQLLGHPIEERFADEQIERSWELGPYRTSSMIDWQMRRPVEVEAIWGEPWRQGVAVGASMPRLETIYQLIKKLTLRVQ